MSKFDKTPRGETYRALRGHFFGRKFKYEFRAEEVYPADDPEYPGEVKDCHFCEPDNVTWERFASGKVRAQWSVFAELGGAEDKQGELELFYIDGKVVDSVDWSHLSANEKFDRIDGNSFKDLSLIPEVV